MNKQVLKKKSQRRYNIPVIGHFFDQSIEFPSILEAEKATGISYHLIFDNCIGKIRSAQGTHWEYVDGKNWIKYKAKYIRNVRKYTRYENFNG